MLSLELKTDVLAEGALVRDGNILSRKKLVKRIEDEKINYSVRDKSVWALDNINPRFRDDVEASLESHDIRREEPAQ